MPLVFDGLIAPTIPCENPMTARVMGLFRSKDHLAHLYSSIICVCALFPCTIKVDAECDG